MGDYIQEFSVSQLNNKHHSTPKEIYKPCRRYRKLESISKRDEETRVPRVWNLGSMDLAKSRETKKRSKPRRKRLPRLAAIPGRMKSELASEEDECVVEQGALSSSTVGSIVGLQSEEISQIASEYAERQAELQENLEARGERTGGELVASLEKQIAVQEKKLEQERSELISKQYEADKVKLGKIRFFRLERTVRFLHFKGRLTKSRRVPNLHNIREDFWNCTNTECHKNEVLSKLKTLGLS
ncbi:coiled-coil domain-containing protein 93-like isoform X2 [Montipora capricornis]|uniref:coiled-coil domain-containing protein 93-like isoform X2 n=1 Tax=Montipora capricornis TaxID=246305 RepID=UPI0035F197EB